MPKTIEKLNRIQTGLSDHCQLKARHNGCFRRIKILGSDHRVTTKRVGAVVRPYEAKGGKGATVFLHERGSANSTRLGAWPPPLLAIFDEESK